MLDWLISLVAAFVKNEVYYFFLAAVGIAKTYSEGTLAVAVTGPFGLTGEAVTGRVPADDWERQEGGRAGRHVMSRAAARVSPRGGEGSSVLGSQGPAQKLERAPHGLRRAQENRGVVFKF